MSITIKFLINLDTNEYHTIVAQLKSAKFDVDSLTNLGETIPIPSELFCSKQFEEWPQVINEQNSLHAITGVRKIFVFNHEVNKDKQKWYRHWIFPMLISMGVTMGSSALLINRIKPDSVLQDYLLLSVIPPILALASNIGVIKAKS